MEPTVYLKARAKRAGQVTVELLLVLPVFMLILFFIMEIGNLAYQTILVHHCAYELARIGSLVAGPSGAQTGGGNEQSKMESVKNEMLPKATLSSSRKDTYEDPQPKATGKTHMNQDLQVTLTIRQGWFFPAQVFFCPISPGRSA